MINGTLHPTDKPSQRIILSGKNLPGGSDGLRFDADAKANTSGSGSIVLGLTIRSFRGSGILIQNVSDVRVGGGGSGQGNLLVGNSAAGISIMGETNIMAPAPTVKNIVIVGNWIGADFSLYADPVGTNANQSNGWGINIVGNSVSDVYIGLPGLAQANAILNNLYSGIYIQSANNVTVMNNFVGLGPGAQSGLGSGEEGIKSSYETSLVIGGVMKTTPQGWPDEAANVISNNRGEGIYIVATPGVLDTTANNLVKGNFIGLEMDGKTPAPNLFGIRVENTKSVTIGDSVNGGGNVVSGNLSDGIQIVNSKSKVKKMIGGKKMVRVEPATKGKG